MLCFFIHFYLKNVSRGYSWHDSPLKMVLCCRHLLHKNDTATLNKKRSQRFLKSKLKLESLPPTEAAAEQHALRCYAQIQIWLCNKINVCDWGWKIFNEMLLPVFTTGDMLIPPEILSEISCKCQSGCKRSSNCSCRKHGVKCSEICRNCIEDCCTNWPKLLISSFDGDSDVDDDFDINTDVQTLITDEIVEEIDCNDIAELYENYESEDESENETESLGSSSSKKKKIT